VLTLSPYSQTDVCACGQKEKRSPGPTSASPKRM
jgi:hypothetical protein